MITIQKEDKPLTHTSKPMEYYYRRRNTFYFRGENKKETFKINVHKEKADEMSSFLSKGDMIFFKIDLDNNNQIKI